MSLQKRVYDWVVGAYGQSVADDAQERAMRVFEEAAELAQSVNVPKEMLDKITTRAYSRPKGLVVQEMAQVQLTLYAFAELADTDLWSACNKELERVKERPNEYWRARYEAKLREGIAQ